LRPVLSRSTVKGGSKDVRGKLKKLRKCKIGKERMDRERQRPKWNVK
jgi:hypothetical protein